MNGTEVLADKKGRSAHNRKPELHLVVRSCERRAIRAPYAEFCPLRARTHCPVVRQPRVIGPECDLAAPSLAALIIAALHKKARSASQGIGRIAERRCAAV